jgi:hypothetical protein
MINSWFRDSLCRDTAPVLIYPISTTKTTFQSLIKIVPRSHLRQLNLCPDGKKHAIAGLHRDKFLVPPRRVPGSCPDAASANATSLYCRAVMWYFRHCLQNNYHNRTILNSKTKSACLNRNYAICKLIIPICQFSKIYSYKSNILECIKY